MMAILTEEGKRAIIDFLSYARDRLETATDNKWIEAIIEETGQNDPHFVNDVSDEFLCVLGEWAEDFFVNGWKHHVRKK